VQSDFFARPVAAIVAESRIRFYVWQQLLQTRLHHVDTSATCVATPLRDKLQRKLHRVSAPLSVKKMLDVCENGILPVRRQGHVLGQILQQYVVVL
jgi:hypothetical protein